MTGVQPRCRNCDITCINRLTWLLSVSLASVTASVSLIVLFECITLLLAGVPFSSLFSLAYAPSPCPAQPQLLLPAPPRSSRKTKMSLTPLPLRTSPLTTSLGSHLATLIWWGFMYLVHGRMEDRGRGRVEGGRTDGVTEGRNDITWLCHILCVFNVQFSQPACSPVCGMVSSTDPQPPSSRRASLEFFRPSKIVPTNTALRGWGRCTHVWMYL